MATTYNTDESQIHVNTHKYSSNENKSIVNTQTSHEDKQKDQHHLEVYTYKPADIHANIHAESRRQSVRSMPSGHVPKCEWEHGVCVVLIRNLLDSGGGNQREHLCGVPVAVLFATRKLESIQLLGA